MGAILNHFRLLVLLFIISKMYKFYQKIKYFFRLYVFKRAVAMLLRFDKYILVRGLAQMLCKMSSPKKVFISSEFVSVHSCTPNLAFKFFLFLFKN